MHVTSQVDNRSRIKAIISDDPIRRRVLEIVRSLNLPDCWVGAGFVRNAVWDHLHGRSSSRVSTDVDVIWFDATRCTPEQDEALEAVLSYLDPKVPWSVKNQARMHVKNGDEPYQSATDAMRYWPETATAVAIRMRGDGTYEITAPLGLDDLFDMVIRPAGRFATDKNGIYQDRVTSKNWLKVWPMLTALG
ncbi:nucleotidyltransferase family protein [Pseudomonas sp. NBRC 111119]|uniref:nucleotidyltransferase family protein n=1 Tax=Pseudomonas sp. NBRC 111119 TaxID=1661034 RepID=UPI000760D2C7|nr:nucleotidyltransferase family protein [Pseudomonas sp. NBRC 111119]